MNPNTVIEETVEVSIVDALKIIMATVMTLAGSILLFAYAIRQFLI